DDVVDPVQLEPGDCFPLPRGRPFRLASDPSLMSVDAATLFATTKNGTIASFNGGGDCFIVGAHFALAGNHTIILLAALPPGRILRKNRTNGASLLFGSDDPWAARASHRQQGWQSRRLWSARHRRC